MASFPRVREYFHHSELTNLRPRLFPARAGVFPSFLLILVSFLCSFPRVREYFPYRA